MAVTRPLVDTLAEKLQKQQEADALKGQVSAFRGWQRFAAKHAAPVVPSVVPGYAAGGRIGWGRPSNSFLQDTPVVPSPNAGYDVIPRPNQPAPTPSFTVDQQPSYAPPPSRGYDVIPRPNQPPPQDTFAVNVMQTAARLNPAAAAYEDARSTDSGLRPSNFQDRLRSQHQAQSQAEADAVRPFAPTDALQAQKEAFMGLAPGTLEARAIARLSPDDQQALTVLAGALEAHGATAEDLVRYLEGRKGKATFNTAAPDAPPVAFALATASQTMGLLKEAKRQVRGGADPQVVAQQLQAQVQEQQTGNVRKPSTFVPAPVHQAIAQHVPVIGPELASSLDWLGSNQGIAMTLATGGVGALEGGAVKALMGLGTSLVGQSVAGGIAEKAGLPEPVVMAARVIGSLLQPEMLSGFAQKDRLVSLLKRQAAGDVLTPVERTEVTTLMRDAEQGIQAPAQHTLYDSATTPPGRPELRSPAQGQGVLTAPQAEVRVPPASAAPAEPYATRAGTPALSAEPLAGASPQAPEAVGAVGPSPGVTAAAPQFGTNPPPVFGSTQPKFMGEQGGIQKPMFTPEQTGQQGQIGLGDVAGQAAPTGELRQIEEEIRLQQSLGRNAEATKQIASLEEQANILRDWQARGVTDPAQQAAELSDMAMTLEGKAPAGRLSFWSPAYGSPEAAQREFANRSIPKGAARNIAGVVSKAEYAAQGSAIEEIAGRLGLPVSIGGGSPLTAAEMAARSAPELAAAKAVASPARDTREAWRLYAGAVNTSNLRIQNWQRAAYDIAKQDGIQIARQPTDQQLGILEHIWLHDPTAGAPANEQRFIQALYDQHTATTARLIAADPEFTLIPDHFPHMFEQSKVGQGVGGFNLRPGFTRERKLLGPLAEILRDNPNLQLKTYDPVKIVAMYQAGADNYIASLDAIRGLKAKGLIVPAKVAPSGWRPVDIAPFKIGQKLQGWVAQPKVATTLEQMFGKSAFDPNGLLHAVKIAQQSAFKVKVFGGLFQGIDYTARGMGLGTSELARGHPLQAAKAWFSPIRAVARSVIPGLDAATMRAAEKNPELMALYRNGLGANVDPSIADQAIRGLGGIVPQTVAGHEIPGASQLQQVLEFVSGGAYQHFHTEMLEQAGLVNLQKQLRGGVPLEEAARRASEETNVFFSSIPNWQSAVKSATARDALRIPFFATGELEGWFRLPVQAPAGFAGLIGGTVIAAELLNKQFTGQWLSQEQLKPYVMDKAELKNLGNPLSAFHAGVPGVDYNTHFLRPELPWRGPDGRKIYLDLLGQADTPFRWALDPMFALQTRLGQIPNAGINFGAFVSGKAPPFGSKMNTYRDVGRNIAQQFSPITIAGLAGTERGRIGTLGAGIQMGGVNVSAQPLAERRAEVIQQELPNLAGHYDKPPTRYGELLPSDQQIIDQKYPNLFSEKFNASSQATLADISGRQQSAITGSELDRAKARLTEDLNGIQADARTATTSDQAERKRLADDYRNSHLGHTYIIEDAIKGNPDFFTPKGKPISNEGRILSRYFALLDGLPKSPKPEDWDKFDADFATQFSAADQKVLDTQLGVGKHPMELAWKADQKALQAYYNIPVYVPPVGATATPVKGGRIDARETYRKQNPEVDGILWALGSVSRVMAPSHRQAAIDAYRALYGVAPQNTDIALPATPAPKPRTNKIRKPSFG